MDYAVHYDRLCNRARSRTLPPGVYFERHHVIPRCLGGGDEQSNLVALTPEEHYTAHLLLVRMHPGHNGLVFAAHMMTVDSHGTRPTNKKYGWLRRKMSVAISNRPAEIMERIRQAHIGSKRTPEQCERISAALRGKKRGPHSEEHRQRISVANKGNRAFSGRRHSEETKQKMSDAAKARDSNTYDTVRETMRTRIVSDVTRQKMSTAAKNRSPEHRQKLADARRGKTPRLGHKLSEETKRKISESHKARRKVL